MSKRKTAAGREQVRTPYRTPQQPGLLERSHQNLKREEIYSNLYRSPVQARDRPAAFHHDYNEVRTHWALVPESGGGSVTPAEVYWGSVPAQLPSWQGWVKGQRGQGKRSTFYWKAA